MATIFGTPASDFLQTSAPGDILIGLGGGDILLSRFGSTQLFGDAGDDLLLLDIDGAASADGTLAGGGGSDSLAATIALESELALIGEAMLRGGSGDDRLWADVRVASEDATARTELRGGGDDDLLVALAGSQSIAGTQVAENRTVGGFGDDRLIVEAFADADGSVSASNRADGGFGEDSVFALARATGPDAVASNTIRGGDDDDFLEGVADALFPFGNRTASNWMAGGDGDDNMSASAVSGGGEGPARASNILDGGDGDDNLVVEGNVTEGTVRNELAGGDGDDSLRANAVGSPPLEFDGLNFLNLLVGGSGQDELAGGVTDDVPLARSVLRGGSGADVLSVLNGVGNVLAGGAGDDQLQCGNGSDRCVFRPGTSDDTISGFDTEADLIRLVGFGFDSFDDLTLLAENGDTRIDLGSGDSVLLLDVARMELGAENFLFA